MYICTFSHSLCVCLCVFVCLCVLKGHMNFPAVFLSIVTECILSITSPGIAYLIKVGSLTEANQSESATWEPEKALHWCQKCLFCPWERELMRLVPHLFPYKWKSLGTCLLRACKHGLTGTEKVAICFHLCLKLDLMKPGFPCKLEILDTVYLFMNQTNFLIWYIFNCWTAS